MAVKAFKVNDVDRIFVNEAGGGGSLPISDSGIPIGVAQILNFTGDVVVTVNGGDPNQIDVAIGPGLDLQEAYDNGAAGQQYITLSPANLGVTFKEPLAPFNAVLFSVETDAGLQLLGVQRSAGAALISLDGNAISIALDPGSLEVRIGAGTAPGDYLFIMDTVAGTTNINTKNGFSFLTVDNAGSALVSDSTLDLSGGASSQVTLTAGTLGFPGSMIIGGTNCSQIAIGSAGSSNSMGGDWTVAGDFTPNASGAHKLGTTPLAWGEMHSFKVITPDIDFAGTISFGAVDATLMNFGRASATVTIDLQAGAAGTEVLLDGATSRLALSGRNAVAIGTGGAAGVLADPPILVAGDVTIGSGTSVNDITLRTNAGKTITLRGSLADNFLTIQGTDGTVHLHGRNATVVDGGAVNIGPIDAPEVNLTKSGGKLGAFAAVAVVQQTATGATGFTANASANAAFAESTYTGGVGATAYTVGDLVAAFKNYGFLVS